MVRGFPNIMPSLKAFIIATVLQNIRKSIEYHALPKHFHKERRSQREA